MHPNPPFEDVVRRLTRRRCSGSGAYVLEMHPDVRSYFDGVISHQGVRRVFGLTHGAFGRHKQYDIPIRVTMPCDGYPRKRTALVYRFGNYLYLKLERYPAHEAKHLRNALQRYILHKKNKHPTRRESDTPDDAMIQENASAFGDAAVFEKRVGNEIYVPASVVRELVFF